MDKIAELLEKLENKVTPTIAKRLDGLNNLETRLAVAKKDLDASPDDEELKESHQEIVDYIEDYKEDLIEDLESLRNDMDWHDEFGDQYDHEYNDFKFIDEAISFLQRNPDKAMYFYSWY